VSEVLAFVVSVTKRRPIKNILLVDPLTLQAFGQGDNVQGRATIVFETGDVTNPTAPAALDGSNGITIWDGAAGLIYAVGSIVGVQNGNDLVYTIQIASANLNNALATAPFVNAIFEIRATITPGQDTLVMAHPIAIRKSGGPLVTGVAVWATPGLIYNSAITGPTGAGNTITNVATTGLATGTMLKTVYSPGTQEFELVTGAANPADPGQIAPFDYSLVSNNRHWQKVL